MRRLIYLHKFTSNKTFRPEQADIFKKKLPITRRSDLLRLTFLHKFTIKKTLRPAQADIFTQIYQ